MLHFFRTHFTYFLSTQHVLGAGGWGEKGAWAHTDWLLAVFWIWLFAG